MCVYMCVGWLVVEVYGISTLVGYLMSNPLYTYIYEIWMICERIICR